MTFNVELPVLYQASTDMSEIGNQVGLVRRFADSYLWSPIEGGTFITDAGAEVNRLGARLAETYSESGVRGLFDSSSISLQQMARDYSEVDKAAAARADANSNKLGPVTPDGDITSGSNGRDSKVDTMKLQSKLQPPSDTFEQYSDFMAIGDTVSNIASLEWAFAFLPEIGIMNPVTYFLEYFEGDWVTFGQSVSSIRNLQNSWHAIAGNVNLVRKNLDGGWDGTAASTTLAWFGTLKAACTDHAGNLGQMYGRINAEAHALRAGVETLEMILDELISLIPSSRSMAVAIVLERLGRYAAIVGYIQDAVKVIQASLTVALGIVALISQLATSQGEFDAVARPVALDVNG